MPAHRIHTIQPEEADQVRRMRLAMILDTPIAFGESYEEALALPPEEWERRALRRTGHDSTGYAAVDEATGEWIGAMNSELDDQDPAVAWLGGVWVRPDRRGGGEGVADALLDAVLTWTRAQDGVKLLRLEVHETNSRAIAFYERRGFVRNGVLVPYVLDPSTRELEMDLAL